MSGVSNRAIGLAKECVGLIGMGIDDLPADHPLMIEAAAMSDSQRRTMEIFVAGAGFGRERERKDAAMRVRLDSPPAPPTGGRFTRSIEDDGQPAWVIVWIVLAFLFGVIAAAIVIGDSRL
jgi:hypothetical protein